MSAVTSLTFESIQRDPAFLKLARTRAVLRWSLSILTFVVFFGFVLSIAFGRQLFSIKLGDSIIPLGFLCAGGLGAFVIVVTGLYVWVANTVFGPLTEGLVTEDRP